MDEVLSNVLLYAVKNGDKELFKKICDENHLEKLDKGELTALRKDIYTFGATVDFIEYAAGSQSKFDYIKKNRIIVLHYAVLNNNLEVVKHYIAKASDVDVKDADGATALACVVTAGEKPEVVKLLVDAGADPKIRLFEDMDLLHLACVNPNPEMVKYLMKFGFDPEDRDGLGRTALLNAACCAKNLDVVSAFVEAGADISAKTNAGENLYFMAAHNPDSSIARFVSDSFTVFDPDSSGHSCIEYAFTCCPSIDTMNVYTEEFWEDLMVNLSMNPSVEVVENLISNGFSRNVMTSDGVTFAMMVAQFNTNPDILLMLYNHGLNLAQKDRHGHNICHFAASNSDHSIYNWMQDQEMFKNLLYAFDDKTKKPSYYLTHPQNF